MLAPGILTHRQIQDLVRAGVLTARREWSAVQFQPTTLDLRLGEEALAIRAGFLPAGGLVASAVAPLVQARLDLTAPGGAVLRRGQVYLVRLLEELALPAGLAARANPRSSTGRIDVFTRTVVDRHDRFDDIPAGYHGPLWLEIVPRSFDIRVALGQRLNQVRFLSGRSLLPDDELRERVVRQALLPDGAPHEVQDASLLLGLSLLPERAGGPVGFRARAGAPTLDLARLDHDAAAYFEPVHPEADGALTLTPEDFFILASRERLRIPPDLAAEMLPYDVGMGELRTNYAGFFDPGFGWGPDSPHGARAVLEVRAHDVPFRVEHGQPIFRLQFSATVAPCEQLYGGGGSAYQNQGLALSRYFRA
ncbi:MAG: 2'-deoxycytidine 5'-triphosphate deaminase [Planctomycetota bacterium]